MSDPEGDDPRFGEWYGSAADRAKRKREESETFVHERIGSLLLTWRLSNRVLGQRRKEMAVDESVYGSPEGNPFSPHNRKREEAKHRADMLWKAAKYDEAIAERHRAVEALREQTAELKQMRDKCHEVPSDPERAFPLLEQWMNRVIANAERETPR